jgi:non-heme chloroperoxidase
MVFLLMVAPSIFAQSRSEFFKTSDGIRIHYLQAGSGQPLVFIPGWTMPAWIWQKQIDEFSKRYEVIAVDPRSQGESDKPTYGHTPETRARDYKELVDHLALKQPVLVGWSMGCPELLKYVEQFGTSNVRALVIVDGFVAEKPSMDFFNFMSGLMNDLQTDRMKVVDGFVRSMFKKPQPEEYLKRVMEASTQVPVDTAVVLMYNMMAVKDYSAAFAKIDRPVLFAYQPQTEPRVQFMKSKLADRMRMERFEGAGHALFVDDPEKFDSVLQNFLQSLPN